MAEVNTMFHGFHGTWCWHVQTDRLPRSGKQATPSVGEANNQMLSVKSDVYRTFLDPFQGRLHGRLDVLQMSFVVLIQDGVAGNDVNQDMGRIFRPPLRCAVQNGGPSASGRHLGWPHFRNRKWGHPRWWPEAEGPPFCTAHRNGSKNPPYTTCNS